jgi:hypothetical protein
VRNIALLLAAVLVSGCAIIDAPNVKEDEREANSFEVIDEALRYDRVEHGIVTVRQIHPRSDIVVMPPSMQHVVWQRDGSAMPAGVTPRAVKPKKEKDEVARRPIDSWPLLEEDMNFDSEIGRVEMCRPTQACVADEPCEDMVPRETGRLLLGE